MGKENLGKGVENFLYVLYVSVPVVSFNNLSRNHFTFWVSHSVSVLSYYFKCTKEYCLHLSVHYRIQYFSRMRPTPCPHVQLSNKSPLTIHPNFLCSWQLRVMGVILCDQVEVEVVVTACCVFMLLIDEMSLFCVAVADANSPKKKRYVS